MNKLTRGFTLLYIPRSGLFYDGGSFLDGFQNRITWSRSIRIYPTHSAAEVAKQKILAKYPTEYAGGQIVVLAVEVKEKNSGVQNLESEPGY